MKGSTGARIGVILILLPWAIVLATYVLVRCAA